MPVVFLIALLVVLAGVYFAATGRGGEMAYEPADHAPLDLGPVSAADVALLRPPTALWGYNMQVTDEALDYIARAMRDRDVTIAHLQQQLAGRGLHEPDLTDTPPPYASSVPTDAKANWTLVAARPHEATQPSEVGRPADYDTLGPQGPYDTHGWWAEQEEEAAREEDARRDAEAEKARQTPSDGLAAAGYPADQPSPPSGRTPTTPNPTRAAGVTPDDDALAVAEEQAW